MFAKSTASMQMWPSSFEGWQELSNASIKVLGVLPFGDTGCFC